MKQRYSLMITLAFLFAAAGCGNRNKDNAPTLPQNLSVTLAPTGSHARITRFTDALSKVEVNTLETKAGLGANNRVDLAINDLPKNLPLANIESIAFRFYLKEHMHYLGTGPYVLIAVDLDGDGTQDDTLVAEPIYLSGYTSFVVPGAGRAPVLLRTLAPLTALPLNTGILSTVDANNPGDKLYSYKNIACPGSTTRVDTGGAVPANMKSLANIVLAFPGATVLGMSLAVGSRIDPNLAQKSAFVHRFEVRLKNGSVRTIRF